MCKNESKRPHCIQKNRRREPKRPHCEKRAQTPLAVKAEMSPTPPYTTDSFKSPIAIAKEIDKCMGSNKLQLKFASIKGNLLTMATDDPATH